MVEIDHEKAYKKTEVRVKLMLHPMYIKEKNNHEKVF